MRTKPLDCTKGSPKTCWTHFMSMYEFSASRGIQHSIVCLYSTPQLLLIVCLFSA
jgi:hypothetical protein